MADALGTVFKKNITTVTGYNTDGQSFKHTVIIQ
jgi:hypothetical protein